MLRKHFWMSRRNRPIGSLPSRPVWVVSMRSSSTTMCASAKSYPSPSLTDHSQQIQDVKDRLEELIPWVAKLEGTLTKANAKDRDEAERRTQLEKFASHLTYISPHAKTDPV